MAIFGSLRFGMFKSLNNIVSISEILWRSLFWVTFSLGSNADKEEDPARSPITPVGSTGMTILFCLPSLYWTNPIRCKNPYLAPGRAGLYLTPEASTRATWRSWRVRPSRSLPTHPLPPGRHARTVSICKKSTISWPFKRNGNWCVRATISNMARISRRIPASGLSVKLNRVGVIRIT